MATFFLHYKGSLYKPRRNKLPTLFNHFLVPVLSGQKFMGESLTYYHSLQLGPELEVSPRIRLYLFMSNILHTVYTSGKEYYALHNETILNKQMVIWTAATLFKILKVVLSFIFLILLLRYAQEMPPGLEIYFERILLTNKNQELPLCHNIIIVPI